MIGGVTSDVPFSRPHRPDLRPGDVAYAPRELMSGPGRSWDAEPRWRWARIRLGGRWRPVVVERWRLHQGSTRWAALVRWDQGPTDWAWILYEPATVRRAPRPTTDNAPAGNSG